MKIASFIASMLITCASFAQPAPPADDVATLRAEITSLKNDVAVLKDENRRLRAKVEQLTKAPELSIAGSQPEPPNSTNLSRLMELKARNNGALGSNPHWDEYIASAKEADAKIASYLKDHPVSDKVRSGLWMGKPTIGMTETELNMLGTWAVSDETADTKSGVLRRSSPDGGQQEWSLTLSDGKVTSASVR